MDFIIIRFWERERFMLFIYNLIRYFLYPFLFLILVFNKKIRIFFSKRLRVKKINRDKYYWVHLSSVGELNLSEKLIEKILKKNKKVFVTLMTDTGMDLFNKRYSGNPNITAIYFPLDDYFLIKKIIKMLDIEKLIVIETEIWPNLYSAVSRKTDIIIINGRISDKTFRKYKKIKKIISQTLNKCKKIIVQSNLDFQRYKELGVKEELLKVYPNLKYTIDYPILSEEEKNKMLKRIKIENRKIITAGSTRDKEEEAIIEVFREINIKGEYQLLLVPRHLNRVSEIEKLCENMDFSLYSEGKKTDIIIVDEMGILRDIYQISDIVFVGGTLVNIGGHSILEPLYYGKIPVIGKYYSNIRDVVDNANELNMVRIAKNKEELKDAFLKLDKENIQIEEFFKKYNLIDNIMEEIL